MPSKAFNAVSAISVKTNVVVKSLATRQTELTVCVVFPLPIC